MPIINFQGLLGLFVLGAAGFFAWFHLGGTIYEERPVRALAKARELAAVVLDYHEDTGGWPVNSDREIELALLLGREWEQQEISQAGVSGGVPGNLPDPETGDSPSVPGRSWLEEIPLDPWDQPYRVMATEAAVAVLSTGPNRKLDTDWTRMWTRPAGINPCDGDDLGVVLETDPEGGSL